MRWLLSLAIVGVIFGVILPRLVDMEAVWATLVRMTWLELVTLGLVSAWNLVTYWFLLMLSLPGLSFAQAMIVTETSTAAANALPGGQAVGMGLAYRMYSSWGFRRSAIALALVISGVGDLFAKLAMPAMALFVLVLYGDANESLRTASYIALVILVAGVVVSARALRSESTARRAGDALAAAATRVVRLWGRSPVTGWGEHLSHFRAETAESMRGRWPALVGVSLLSHFSLFVVLLLAMRHVGISQQEVGWAEALGSFAFVRLLSAIPITPGGIGVIELGLTASLALAGGRRVEVVAAVLVFRAMTYLLQIPFGAVTYLVWQHSAAGRRTEIEAPAAP